MGKWHRVVLPANTVQGAILDFYEGKNERVPLDIPNSTIMEALFHNQVVEERIKVSENYFRLKSPPNGWKYIFKFKDEADAVVFKLRWA